MDPRRGCAAAAPVRAGLGYGRDCGGAKPLSSRGRKAAAYAGAGRNNTPTTQNLRGRDWTPEENARLVELAGEGLSAVMIGEAMGRSKSAVLGRLFRLGVPLQSSGAMKRAARARPVQVPPEQVDRRTGCSYVIGDVADPDWRYCHKPVFKGSSWCETHYAKVFQKSSRVPVEDPA